MLEAMRVKMEEENAKEIKIVAEDHD